MPRDNVGRSLSITSQESSYSAVIIADMVAEVQQDHQSPTSSVKKTKDAVQRSNSARSEVLRRKGGKKDETNADHETTVAVDVDKSNGRTTDISRGVILNAYLDHKELKNGSFKAIELQEANGREELNASPPTKKPADAVGSLKDMSVLRRVAFAASFLPSIMFVLCFAVILPCQKKLPCIEVLWTTTLNNTDITYGPLMPGKVVFTFNTSGTHGLQGLDRGTGITAWEERGDAVPRSLQCGHLLTEDGTACLVADEKGNVHFYNAETGEQLLSWDPTNGAPDVPVPSLPAILPDCDGDGIAEVALFTSPTMLKVLFKGFRVSHVELPGDVCGGVPRGLVPWVTVNGTAVVGWCRKDDKEYLFRVTQDKWCSPKKSKEKDVTILDTRTSGTLDMSVILPTESGIFVWSEDEVTLIEKNGQKKWTVNVENHSSKNRFLLFGKFEKTESQVALFSSDILTNLQMTTLSSATGVSAWNRTIDNTEIGDVSLIHGSEKDFVLVVMRKMEKNLTNQVLGHFAEVSTSLINLLTTEHVETKASNGTTSNLVEEVSLLELNGEDTYKIEEKQMSFSEGRAFTTRVEVVPQQNEDGKYLELVTLRRPTELTSHMSSQLTRTNIANWDISHSSAKRCIVKEM